MITAHAEPVASPVRAAISAMPDDMPLRDLIAGLDSDERKAALERLEKLDRGALDTRALVELSEAYRLLGRPNEANTAAQALSSRDTRGPDGEIQSILSLAQAGDYGAAQSAAEGGLKRFPGDKNLLALLHQVKGRAAPRVSGATPNPTALSAAIPETAPVVDGGPRNRSDIVFTPLKTRAKTVVPGIPTGGSTDEPASKIDLDAILPSYALRNYSDQEKDELRRAIAATETATKGLYRRNPSRIADIGGGAASNFIQGVDMALGGGLRRWGIDIRAPQRSCIDHQVALAEPIRAALGEESGLVAEYIHIGGQPWPEHHAIVVHPKDSNIVRSGVVLDPWKAQSSKPADFVYPYTTWKGAFIFNVLGGERREEIKRVDP